MDNQELFRRLDSLHKLDIDAVYSYEKALEHIDVPSVKERITAYRADHERHVVDIEAAIRSIGFQPGERKKDIKGGLLEGFTALSSSTGTQGALTALKRAEELTNSKYREASGWTDLPAHIMQLVEKNYRDEQMHLNYINQSIQNKVWEQAPSRR